MDPQHKNGWQSARVSDPWRRECPTGVVVKWEPLSSGLCDALVHYDDGYECWTATHTLRAVNDDGSPDPLPRMTRQEAIKLADEQTLRDLQVIRANLVSEWRERWPGCEFGKAIVGMAIDAAIADVKSLSR